MILSPRTVQSVISSSGRELCRAEERDSDEIRGRGTPFASVVASCRAPPPPLFKPGHETSSLSSQLCDGLSVFTFDRLLERLDRELEPAKPSLAICLHP
jgi:hypothetical protein